MLLPVYQNFGGLIIPPSLIYALPETSGTYRWLILLSGWTVLLLLK